LLQVIKGAERQRQEAMEKDAKLKQLEQTIHNTAELMNKNMSRAAETIQKITKLEQSGRRTGPAVPRLPPLPGNTVPHPGNKEALRSPLKVTEESSQTNRRNTWPG